MLYEEYFQRFTLPSDSPFLWHRYFSTVELQHSYACLTLYYATDQLFGSTVYVRDKTYKKIKMSDCNSNDEMSFTVEKRGHLYELEYTEEELLQMEIE